MKMLLHLSTFLAKDERNKTVKREKKSKHKKLNNTLVVCNVL